MILGETEPALRERVLAVKLIPSAVERHDAKDYLVEELEDAEALGEITEETKAALLAMLYRHG